MSMRLKPTRMHGPGNDCILWEGAGKTVPMTGPAVTVFEGGLKI